VKFNPDIDDGNVTPAVTVKVQPNTQYVTDGYFKRALADGTCTVAIAVLDQAGNVDLTAGPGGTYHIHTDSIYYDNLSLHPA